MCMFCPHVFVYILRFCREYYKQLVRSVTLDEARKKPAHVKYCHRVNCSV
uniref:Uncharacterized protein n=1 Tax=Anguilla anguilla TaxID=7936 RepID=A0A0E9SE50_ANGAN